MTTSTISSPAGFSHSLRSIWEVIKKIPPVYPVFFIIFIVLGFLNPGKYQTMNGIMTFLRTAAPLGVIAIGEMMVLALGGFDLSVGAIVTFVVLVSSKLLANDPANAYPAILIMLGFGVADRTGQWTGGQLFASPLLHRHAGDDVAGQRRSVVLGGRRPARLPDR